MIDWRRVDKYHLRAYRDGAPTGYTIAKYMTEHGPTYMLWSRGDERSQPGIVAKAATADELKPLVQ